MENWEQDLRNKLDGELSNLQTYEIKGYLPFQTDKNGKINYEVNKERRLRILTGEDEWPKDFKNSIFYILENVDEANILESNINVKQSD